MYICTQVQWKNVNMCLCVFSIIAGIKSTHAQWESEPLWSARNSGWPFVFLRNTRESVPVETRLHNCMAHTARVSACHGQDFVPTRTCSRSDLGLIEVTLHAQAITVLWAWVRVSWYLCKGFMVSGSRATNMSYVLPSSSQACRWEEKSDRRRVWHFLWNGGVFRTNVATLNPVAIAKPGTTKKCVALRLTGRRE